jgi:hypothetical protein
VPAADELRPNYVGMKRMNRSVKIGLLCLKVNPEEGTSGMMS